MRGAGGHHCPLALDFIGTLGDLAHFTDMRNPSATVDHCLAGSVSSTVSNSCPAAGRQLSLISEINKHWQPAVRIAGAYCKHSETQVTEIGTIGKFESPSHLRHLRTSRTRY